MDLCVCMYILIFFSNHVGIMLYEFRKVRAIGNFLKKKLKSKT